MIGRTQALPRHAGFVIPAGPPMRFSHAFHPATYPRTACAISGFGPTGGGTVESRSTVPRSLIRW